MLQSQKILKNQKPHLKKRKSEKSDSYVTSFVVNPSCCTDPRYLCAKCEKAQEYDKTDTMPVFPLADETQVHNAIDDEVEERLAEMWAT